MFKLIKIYIYSVNENLTKVQKLLNFIKIKKQKYSSLSLTYV